MTLTFVKDTQKLAELHNEAVNEERKRRELLGASFTVTGYPYPIHLQAREEDKINLISLSSRAERRLEVDPSSPVITYFRDKNNVIHQLTQQQIIELWSLGTDFMESLYGAAWMIKAMGPGVDPTNDELWPSST